MQMMTAAKMHKQLRYGSGIEEGGHLQGHCRKFEHLTWFISSGESIIHALLLR
jgi:hypothetical protein